MLAISLNPTEVAYLQALNAGRRPMSGTVWNLAVATLKRLAALGLIAFRDGLISYSNEIEVTSLGKSTLEMKRDGDFEKVDIGGISWYSFYY
jgi:hypothetical protein